MLSLTANPMKEIQVASINLDFQMAFYKKQPITYKLAKDIIFNFCNF